MRKYIDTINFFNINILKQCWKNGEIFSYNDIKRPYFGICYILSGRIKYETDKEKFYADAGDIVILNKGAYYKTYFSGEKPIDILINFEYSDTSYSANPKLKYQKDEINVFAYNKEKERQIIVLKNRSDVKKDFYDILKYHSRTDGGYMVKSVFYRIVDQIVETQIKDATFKKIKQIIDDDVNFEMNESDLAKRCSISISTLQRTFKKVLGKTLTEYKRELKITKAKELLVTGRYSTEEIAEMLGFCDASYFSKCFKKSEGVSPKKFLKLYYTM